jgi:hypothetical protein
MREASESARNMFSRTKITASHRVLVCEALRVQVRVGVGDTHTSSVLSSCFAWTQLLVIALSPIFFHSDAGE